MKRQRIQIAAVSILAGVFATHLWQTSQQKAVLAGAVSRLSTADRESGPTAAAPKIQTASDQPLTPSWAIPFGQEFWKPAAKTTKAPATTMDAPVDLQGVMERVSHALVANFLGGNPGVQAQTYVAVFDAEGIRFSSYRPVEVETPRANPTKNFPAPPRLQPSAPALLPDPKANALFKTVSIRQGATTLYDAREHSPASWKIEGNTAQALRAKEAAIVEHYEARSEGVAVTWVIKEKPGNQGPLQIAAEVEGLTHATQSKHGHHFADADGVSRVRVGNVTAVDAAGQRWDLGMQFGEGRLQVEVPETVLTVAAYPLAIDPVIGAEFGINQPIAFPLQGHMPAIASNGRDYLLAWKLTIRIRSDDYQEQIRATRIGRDGSILDPAGILVVAGDFSVNFPSVASDGQGFLVTWADSRQWDGGDNWTLQIYGGRVSASGQVLDPEGLWLSHGASSTGYKSSASGNANGYLVVWEDLRNRGTNDIGIVDIYGTRVASGGAVLDYVSIPICTASNNQTAPVLASTSDKFLVAWTDSRGKMYDPYIRTDYTAIYGAMVGNNGVVEQSDGFLIHDGPWNQSLPTVAANGADFFVAWEDDRNASGPPWPGNSDIFGTRVSSTGAVLDPNAISLTTAPGTQSAPAAAFDGTHWFVAWEDGRHATSSISKWNISAARIANDGSMVSPPDWVVATNTSSRPAPAVAANNGELLLAWNADQETFRPFSTGIMGTRIRAGAVLDPEPRVLSVQGGSESVPQVAWNGSVYLLAWALHPAQGLSYGSSALRGARLSAAGELLDPAGIAIATMPDAEVILPSIAANGQDFLVAWADSRNSRRDVFGTLIKANGQVVSSNGAPICTAPYHQFSPWVASSGSQFLVAWLDFRNSEGVNVAPDIYGARVSSSGAVLDPDGFPISTAPRDQYIAAVAGNGAHWLVTWTDSRLSTNWPWITQVMGARVDASGQVLEPDGLVIDPHPKSIQSVGVAAHGSDFYVAWLEQPSSEDPVPARGTLVSDSGAVAAPGGSLVGNACCEALHLAVTDTAEGFLVTWHSIPLEVLEEYDEEDERLPFHLMGVRVRPDGTQRDLLPLDLTPSAALLGPAQIAGAGSEFLVVYSAPTPVNRVQVRAARLSLGLPTPWEEHTMAEDGRAGSAVFSSSGISLVGTGEGVKGRSDGFYLLHQTLTGDGQIVARFNQWIHPTENAVAGIMFRDTLDASARHVFFGFNTQGQSVFERRKTPNGRNWTLKRPAAAPRWLRLMRQGNQFSAWTSQNGASWNFVWVARINMPNSIEAGLALAAGHTNDATAVSFLSAEVGAVGSNPLSPAPAGGVPAILLGSPWPGLSSSEATGVQLLVYGVPGVNTVLESSSDLSNWTELTRFTLSDMPADFEEELEPLRFYRARQVSQ